MNPDVNRRCTQGPGPGHLTPPRRVSPQCRVRKGYLFYPGLVLVGGRGRGCGAVDRIWSKRLSIITSFSSPATRPPAAGHPPWRHYTPFSLGQHSLIWCRGQARDWTFYVNSIQLPALSSKLIFNDFYICPWSEGSRDLPQFFHFLR